MFHSVSFDTGSLIMILCGLKHVVIFTATNPCK